MKAYAIFVLAAFASLPAAAFEYPVSFTTVDCNGDAGMVSVDVSQVYRLTTVTCGDGTALRQVMIRNGAGSYDIATITADEADVLQRQIRAYSRARREALENGGTVIIGD